VKPLRLCFVFCFACIKVGVHPMPVRYTCGVPFQKKSIFSEKTGRGAEAKQQARTQGMPTKAW
jgi:hypothetical protein